VPAAARPPLRGAEAPERLDWDGFSKRYFADRKRHDPEARSAYVAYRDGLEWRTTTRRLRLVPVADAAPVESGQASGEEAGEARPLTAMALGRPERPGDAR